MQEYAEPVAAAIQKAPEPFAREYLGILAALPEVDFVKIFERHGLNSWMESRLNASACSEDLLVEILGVLATMAMKPVGSEFIAKSPMLEKLMGILGAKQEEDSLVLQIIYVFYQLLMHESVRKVVITETQVPAYLIDLMHDKNPDIRNLCDNTLDMIAVS